LRTVFAVYFAKMEPNRVGRVYQQKGGRRRGEESKKERLEPGKKAGQF